MICHGLSTVCHGLCWSVMVCDGLSWSVNRVCHGVCWSVMVCHGLSRSFMVFHGLSWSVNRVSHGLCWSVMVCHGLSRGHKIPLHELSLIPFNIIPPLISWSTSCPDSFMFSHPTYTNFCFLSRKPHVWTI